MALWIAVLIGAVSAWLAVRIGFYEIWALLVNIAIAIYVAIFLAPRVIDLAPATGRLSAYSTALSMIVLAGGCFAILHGFSYVFLTGQFKVPFPRAFDILLAGSLGFLAGFLACSFLAVAFTTTPLAQQELIDDLGFNRQSEKANIACLAQCGDLIHTLTGVDSRAHPTAAAINRLLDQAAEVSRKQTVAQPDPNEPLPAQTITPP